MDYPRPGSLAGILLFVLDKNISSVSVYDFKGTSAENYIRSILMAALLVSQRLTACLQ